MQGYSKRYLIKMLAASTLALAFGDGAAYSQHGELEINLELSDDNLIELPPSAHFKGETHTEQTKGIPIVTVIVGIIVISYAKELISELWDRVKGTVIFDVRNGKLKASNIPYSTPETVVVTDKGVNIYPRESTSKQVVIDAVTAGIKKDAK